MKKTILVTGGGGYIGSVLVQNLINSGQNVRILDKFLYSTPSMFKKERNRDLIEIVQGDITNPKTLERSIKGISQVIHLAGLVGDPACSLSPKLTEKVNVMGTRLLIDAAIKNSVSNFIFASSCSVYGITKKTATEKSTLNPVSLYSESKIKAENDLLSINNPKFIPTILRFATLFGQSPRPRYDLAVNHFTAEGFFKNKIEVFNGNQWRPFIHVQDISRAIQKVIKAENSIIDRQIFNVGDNSLVYTITELAKITEKTLANDRVNIITKSSVNDPRDYRVSFSKIKKTLDFKKSKKMSEGIKEMVNYLEGNNISYTDPKYSNIEGLKKYLGI